LDGEVLALRRVVNLHRVGHIELDEEVFDHKAYSYNGVDATELDVWGSDDSDDFSFLFSSRNGEIKCDSSSGSA
jgi:hypothetical protein